MKDDDPTLITAMLRYAYGSRTPLPVRSPSIQNALFCVSLYRVADKYAFPELEERAALLFMVHMRRWLEHHNDHDTDGEGSARHQSFCEVVTETYKLPNACLTHPLVSVILDLTDDVEVMLDQDLPLLRSAAKEVAEFGRDMFLHLMSKFSKEAE